MERSSTASQLLSKSNGIDPLAIAAIVSLERQVEKLSHLYQHLSDLVNQPINKKESEDDMVETEQAAEIIHLSRSRFYEVHPLLFNHVQLGRKLLFSRKELQEYLKTGKSQRPASVLNEVEQHRVARLKAKNQRAA